MTISDGRKPYSMRSRHSSKKNGIIVERTRTKIAEAIRTSWVIQEASFMEAGRGDMRSLTMVRAARVVVNSKMRIFRDRAFKKASLRGISFLDNEYMIKGN